MNIFRVYMSSIFIILSLLMSGCLSKEKLPIPTTYQLNGLEHIEVMRKTSSHTLVVTTPAAEDAYNTNKIAYVNRAAPQQIQYFTRTLWIASPSSMLHSLLLDTLARAHIFHAVVTPLNGVVAQRRLNTRIIDFYQIIDNTMEHNQSQAKFVIKVQATLIDNVTNQVIAQQFFKVSIPLHNVTPAQTSIAANRAMSMILREIALFCQMYG